MANTGRDAFQRTAEAGLADAGALTRGLSEGVTDQRLRDLAAMAAHVAAAAPERMADIYDNAAAGWLSGTVSPPAAATLDPLPITPGWWRTFWNIAVPKPGTGRQSYAQQMMELAGELDPQINPRMAAAALDFPGVADAAAQAVSPPHDVERLARFPPASLGYALSQELVRPGSPATDPYWTAVLPYLRHMPSPLNHINVQVIQSLSLWGLLAGYSLRPLDRVALGGFLMGQVGHHYSALASAVTLTTTAVNRPENLVVVLDCIFKGWAHGRANRPLVLVDWEPLWTLRVDQVRETLGIQPFDSPYRGARPTQGWAPRVV